MDFEQENIQEISKISDYYNWLINCEKYDYANFDLKWLTELSFPNYIKVKLQQIEPLKEIVASELKINYDDKLAEFYIKNLIK